MALKDRIYSEVSRAIRTRIAEWRDERRGLLGFSTRVAELNAMIAEAEKELAVAEEKVPVEDRQP